MNMLNVYSIGVVVALVVIGGLIYWMFKDSSEDFTAVSPSDPAPEPEVFGSPSPAPDEKLEG